MIERLGCPGRRAVLAGGMASLLCPAAQGAAAVGPIRLGLLTDMSSWGSGSAGAGSVQAVRMAIAEFGGTVGGRTVEILVADHQMKLDVGAGIARKWFDEEDVRAIIDVPNSSIGINIHNLARDRDRIALLSGTYSSDVTNQLCTATTAQFGLDTYALANVPVQAIIDEGGKSWFFITADFTFGQVLEADTAAAVTRLGGKVVGSVKHPVNTSDFSSYLLAAQVSGADVVALANSAEDTTNSLKQAAEFGMAGKQKIAALLVFVTSVHAIGLDAAQGVYASLWTYWDLDEKTRSWSTEFFKATGAMPSDEHAGCYSATLHYLKAVRATGSVDTASVMQAMRMLPIEDAFTHNGRLREDGRVLKDVYLGRAKAPSASRYPWDDLEILGAVPPGQAFRSPSDSKCSLLRP